MGPLYFCYQSVFGLIICVSIFTYAGSSIGEGSILPAFSPEGHENILNDECHVIEYLFTDPYYRRSGYGKSVLTAMQDYCVSQVGLPSFCQTGLLSTRSL